MTGTGVEVVYTDLDGTMFGAFGSFFADEHGAVTLAPAQALVDLHTAGVALVLVSGRTRLQLREAAHIVGADGYVGEMGALVAWDHSRHLHLLRGAMPAELTGTPYAVMRAGGLPEALFERWPGRLEWHAPWHVGHEADLMLRGNVPLDEVHAWLAGHGWPWLRLHDNGVLPRRELPGPAHEPVHVYHLMPDGIDKGSAVAWDLARRGLRPEQAVAVGDSLSDLTMAPYVGRFFLTANGGRAPRTAAAAAALPNVTRTAGAACLGWVEAVRTALGAPAAPAE